jgi:hypothetical protein
MCQFSLLQPGNYKDGWLLFLQLAPIKQSNVYSILGLQLFSGMCTGFRLG